MSHSQGISSNPSWAESNKFLVLFPISLKSTLILSYHLRLGLPKGLFPVGLSVKILKAFLPSSFSSILSTWPAHLNLLDLITLTILGEWYKLWSSSWWSLLYSPFAYLLGSNENYSLYTHWAFLCFTDIYPCTVLYCLHRRLLYSTDHRSRNALQLCPCSYKWYIETSQNRWNCGKWFKRNK